MDTGLFLMEIILKLDSGDGFTTLNVLKTAGLIILKE